MKNNIKDYFPEKLITIFKNKAEKSTVKAWQTIYYKDLKPLGLFFIEEGTVILEKGKNDIRRLNAPSFLGTLPFLDDTYYQDMATAGSDCTIYFLNNSSYKDIIKTVPEFAHELLKISEEKNFMKAMVFEGNKGQLKYLNIQKPVPGIGQVLIKVHTCGVCRTDLHIIDKELISTKLPLVPGHQIAGIIEETGKNVKRFSVGDLVGVPWLGFSCGKCSFCLKGQENLCEKAEFTGYQIDGGFAEYAVADARFCFPMPEGYSALQAAPLLCGGLIGYRAYRITGKAEKIGFYGFGSAAHILIQIANFQGKKIFAFTKDNDKTGQEFALRMGACWAGNSSEEPPEILDAAIIFAPDGNLIPIALKAVNKGGIVVCAGIHMSDIPSFPYDLLWGERKICSVANLTRKDGDEFLELVPKVPVNTEVTVYSFKDTQKAIDDLRAGKIKGSAVISII